MLYTLILSQKIQKNHYKKAGKRGQEQKGKMHYDVFVHNIDPALFSL